MCSYHNIAVFLYTTDGSSYSTKWSYSRDSLGNGRSQYSDSSTSVTTTVITTITGKINEPVKDKTIKVVHRSS